MNFQMRISWYIKELGCAKQMYPTSDCSYQLLLYNELSDLQILLV